ncbi:hypothetical protein [Streptomyces sp. NPDC059802]|uniref:hypothetical protein n=1 Tax=Streptomyces sp. NPDC059802 TaxID=3346952 RepID=UPI00365718FF
MRTAASPGNGPQLRSHVRRGTAVRGRERDLVVLGDEIAAQAETMRERIAQLTARPDELWPAAEVRIARNTLLELLDPQPAGVDPARSGAPAPPASGRARTTSQRRGCLGAPTAACGGAIGQHSACAACGEARHPAAAAARSGMPRGGRAFSGPRDEIARTAIEARRYFLKWDGVLLDSGGNVVSG